MAEIGREGAGRPVRGGKVYFVSDAHLGSGADSGERERALCSFLDSIADDCGMLVLLGDMFDFWFSYKHLVPKGGVRLLGRLAAMSDSGIAVHYFTGNHDMWVFDYLEKECGASMHEDVEVMELGGKRFLLGHGDGLGHTDRMFDLWRRMFKSRFNQRLFALLPSALMFPIARRWSDANKRRHVRQGATGYLGDEREGIVIYCKQRLREEHLDYCVFGHRHTPLVRHIGEQTLYVNTGDWLNHRSYAVFDPESGKLDLLSFGRESVL